MRVRGSDGYQHAGVRNECAREKVCVGGCVRVRIEACGGGGGGGGGAGARDRCGVPAATHVPAIEHRLLRGRGGDKVKAVDQA